MHETMAKAHADAASCLKAGTSVDECRTAFFKACGDAKEAGMCGIGSMGPGKHRGMKH